MKNNLKVFQLLIITLISTFCYSQNEKHIDVCGFVKDSTTNIGIEYTTVQFCNPQDGKLIYGIITDSIGKFYLNKVISGDYLLISSCIGYKTIKKNIKIPSKGGIYYFNTLMPPSEYMLNQVEVTAEQKGSKTLVDRTVFVPDSISLNNSVTGLDLLSKAPGVTVRKSDETIKVFGNSNVLVLVDGANSNRNINAIDPKDIEKIEIIDNPSAKYDSDVANVVNIILKDERRKGLKISTNLNYFTENKHNFSNAQVEYEFSKFRIFGMYKLKFNNMSFDYNSLRTSTSEGSEYKIEKEPNSDYTTRGNGHIIQYGMDYYLNKKNTLNFTGNYELYSYRNLSNYRTNYFFDNTLNSVMNTNTDKKGQNHLQNYTIFYKKKFAKENNELTFNTNLYLMKRDYTIAQDALFFSIIDSSEFSLNNNELTKNDNNAVNSKIDYSQPINDYLNMESGLQLYYREIRNTYKNNESGYSFLYNNFRSAVYTQFNYSKEKFSFLIGIRGERFDIGINDTANFFQWNYLPSFSALYKIDGENSIKILYNKKLNYPQYYSLLPFSYYTSDSLSVSTGNPYLKPEKFHNLEMNYSFKKKYTFLSTSIYYRQFDDLIGINSYILPGNILVEQDDNITFSKKIGGYLMFKSVLFGFLQTNLYAELNYNMFTNKKYNGVSLNSWIMTEISLPWDLYLNIEASYSSKEYYYNGYSCQSPLMDELSIGKSILKNKGNISLSLINYFFADKSKEIQFNEDYTLESNSVMNSKCILIRFNYFFTKGKKLKKIERELNMERDEK